MKIKQESEKDTAKVIRKLLKNRFPEVPAKHFSVRTKTYNGGSRIDINWKDYPLESDVKGLFTQDSPNTYHFHDKEENSTYLIDAYVFFNRKISDEREQKIDELIENKYEAEHIIDEAKRNRRERHKIDRELGYQNNISHRATNGFNVSEELEKLDLDSIKKGYLSEFPADYLHKLRIDPYVASAVGNRIQDKNGKEVYMLTDTIDFKLVMSGILKDITLVDFEQGCEGASSKEELDKQVQRVIFLRIMNNLEYLQECIFGGVIRYYTSLVVEKYNKKVETDRRYSKYETEYKDTCLYIKYAGKKDKRYVDALIADIEEQGVQSFDIIRGCRNLAMVRDKKASELLDAVEETKPKVSSTKIQDILVKDIKNMPVAMQSKVRRITSQNEGRWALFAQESGYVCGIIDRVYPVLKYPSKKDSEIQVFQTPFAMYLYNDKTKEVKRVYKYGTDTIEACIHNAKLVARKYDVDTKSVVLATGMYLGGKNRNSMLNM